MGLCNWCPLITDTSCRTPSPISPSSGCSGRRPPSRWVRWPGSALTLLHHHLAFTNLSATPLHDAPMGLPQHRVLRLLRRAGSLTDAPTCCR